MEKSEWYTITLHPKISLLLVYNGMCVHLLTQQNLINPDFT
jgi:hypothetical protein